MLCKIERREQLRGSAPQLAQVYNETYAGTPNYRPVTAEELVAKGEADPRFAERPIYAWLRGNEVLAWCSAEPARQANTGGDIYPYVGGEIVFQPSLIPTRDGWQGRGLEQELLDRVKGDLAAQGQAVMRVVVTDHDADVRELYREAGFAEVGRMVSLRAVPAEVGPPLTPVATRHLREEDTAALLTIHNEAFHEMTAAHGWEPMRAEDWELLRDTVVGYDARGVLLAHHERELAGYVVAMIDTAFNRAHGVKRGWIRLARLGLAVGRKFQGLGVETTLMTAAMVSLVGRGMREVELVADRNNDRALDLYTAAGFEEVREWAVLECPLG